MATPISLTTGQVYLVGWSGTISGASLTLSGNLDLDSDTGLLRFGTNQDTILAWDAANTLAQRNGTNAQTLRIYGTYTSATSNEFLKIFSSGSQFSVMSDQGSGGGSARQLNVGTTGSAQFTIKTADTERWAVSSTGHLLAAADNTYNIGASGSDPASIRCGTSIGIAVGTAQTAAFEIGDGGAQASPEQLFINRRGTSGRPSIAFNWASSSLFGIGPLTNTADNTVRIGNASINADWDASQVTILAVGNSLFGSTVTKYNNITTAGYGVAPIVGYGDTVAATGVTASIATYTVGAADGTFEVSANCLVTTSTTHSFSLDVTYTDEGSTARTMILPVASLAGSFVTGGLITNATGAGTYESPTMLIRAKAATAITVRTSAGGTYTTVTYNARGVISQIS